MYIFTLSYIRKIFLSQSIMRPKLILALQKIPRYIQVIFDLARHIWHTQICMLSGMLYPVQCIHSAYSWNSLITYVRSYAYLFSQLLTRKYDSVRNKDLACLNMIHLRIHMKSLHWHSRGATGIYSFEIYFFYGIY